MNGEKGSGSSSPPVVTWLEQARADLEVAATLHEAGRHAYAALFMQLATEKALKGLYRQRFDESAPVTHNLVYLAERTRLTVPEELDDFLRKLNEHSILNLYPDRRPDTSAYDSERYSREAVAQMLSRTRRLFDWITDHF